VERAAAGTPTDPPPPGAPRGPSHEPCGGRKRAETLDGADPLAGFRDRFVVPDESLVYLDGNSLGRLPRATAARLRHVVEVEWGADLIGSWGASWQRLPQDLGDLIGTGLLGALAGEVVVADSTTVNLYKLAVAALDQRPGRPVVITDRDNFPTDRYVLEGIVRSRGGEIRWIEGDPVLGPSALDVEAALGDDVGLVSLSHVAYKSAAIADIEAITGAAHSAGALVLADLCHSVGAVAVDLQSWGVDLAVGCTYKYLCAGPGAPAFLYVRSALQEQLRQPIWGWWAADDMFTMGQGFSPAPGIAAYLGGSPGVLGLACVEEGARVVIDAGIGPLRDKGVALTSYAVELFDAVLARLGFELGSPRDPDLRGSHVTIRRADACVLAQTLASAGVVGDFRMPDGIRLGLAPLTTRYTDVYDGITRLASLASAAAPAAADPSRASATMPPPAAAAPGPAPA
jgi:kynureninase